jgi:hypothetical protein
MRKTSDLVNEMRQEAKKAWLAAIVVGFETETKFVFSTDRTPLQNLNQLVKNGGSPLGLLRFEKEGTAVQGSYRAFSEYAAEAWVSSVSRRPPGKYREYYRDEPGSTKYPRVLREKTVEDKLQQGNSPACFHRETFANPL